MPDEPHVADATGVCAPGMFGSGEIVAGAEAPGDPLGAALGVAGPRDGIAGGVALGKPVAVGAAVGDVAGAGVPLAPVPGITPFGEGMLGILPPPGAALIGPPL